MAAVVTTYRFGLASKIFHSGADDGEEFTVTTTAVDILAANANRVLFGIRCNALGETSPVAMSFGRDAESPGGTNHGFLLLPQAEEAAAYPMGAAFPGPGGWLVFGPGGSFPFCPLGRISVRTAATTTSVLVMEIDIG